MANSIKGLVQELSGHDVQITQGTVVSASPLQIQMANDEKLVVGSSICYVPQHLTDYQVSVDLSGGTLTASTDESGEHKHEIEIAVETQTQTNVTGGEQGGEEGEGEGEQPEEPSEEPSPDSPSVDVSVSATATGDIQNAGKHSHSMKELSLTKGTLTIYNALKVGDRVHVLSYNGGKQYIVLGRV